MSREITGDGRANMATMCQSIFCFVLVFRLCSGFIKTNALDLAEKVRDDIHMLHNSFHQGTEPGVAVFHRYENSTITAYTDSGPIANTLMQDGHIHNLTLQFVAFGKRFLVDLHLTKDLFSSTYSRKILHDRGKDFQDPLHTREHCYYQGQIQNNPTSYAALSSCDGFRGYVSDGKETYHIDPVQGSLHRVFRNNDFRKLPFKCGTNGHDVFHSPSKPDHKRRKRSIREPYDSNKYTRYVELYMVNDFRTFERHGKNATVVFKRSQDIANIVNSLYRQLNMYIVLVGVEVWSMGDKVVISSSADTTMENFLRYRKERINPYHPNDNAQLITGITFDHGVVGKAIKGPICTHQFSGGVSMDYDGLVTLVATTMAHEMGHNFGMEHDNDTKCSCPQDKCIMAATSGQVSPQHWSSCSQNSLHEAFDLGMDYCLRNPPVTIYDGPVCGNGFVEEGEECDCGLPQDCSNRCCNATNCTLHSQAKCATGRCCDLDTCSMKKQSSLCREPTGDCDLPEFCDGLTEYCPPDVYMKDGSGCAEGQSYCYKGSCKTHNAQCKLLWGNTGRVSDPICFQQLNTRGDHDGNCGYNWTTDKYHACDRENVMCGLLHCVHLNEKLMFWRDNLALDMRANFLTRGNTQYVCRSTMLDVGLDMPDPGLVPDGAKCEDEKICISQKCTPLVKLKIPTCPDCHGNGVCNSEGNCHCHVGYAPPLCDRPGYGGSLNSGPATNEYAKKDLLIGLLVLFLVILPLLVLLILAYINRQRLLAWWKLGPPIKFGVLKKQTQSPPQPPQPRPGASFEKKRWSSAPTKPAANLDISGPLMEDVDRNDVHTHPNVMVKLSGNKRPSSSASPAPPPIYKPPAAASAKLTPTAPPAPSVAPAVSAVPQVHVVGSKDRKNFFANMQGNAEPRSKTDKAPTGTLERPRPSDKFPTGTLERTRASEKTNSGTLERSRPSEKFPTGTLERRGPQMKTPSGTLERPKSPPPPPQTLVLTAGDSTLKRSKDRPTQSPPLSPNKAARKGVQYSQSCREPAPKDALVPGEKLVKRSSFRGAEISNPVLVSTTNRDSQVFADFKLDDTGVIARPLHGKQHSVHGTKPSAEVARDGCRSPVRRSQSDRPISPKPHVGISSSGDDGDGIRKTSQGKAGQGQQNFTARPLPPEPVVEVENEPLYINEGLSDLGDLRAHISSAFDTLKKKDSKGDKPAATANAVSTTTATATRPTPSATVATAKPIPSSITTAKPASSTAADKSRPSFTDPAKSTLLSGTAASKPTQNITISTPKPSLNSAKPALSSLGSENNPSANKSSLNTSSSNAGSSTTKPTVNPSSSILSKSSALERVLNNPMKPFGTNPAVPASASSAATDNSNSSNTKTASGEKMNSAVTKQDSASNSLNAKPSAGAVNRPVVSDNKPNVSSSVGPKPASTGLGSKPSSATPTPNVAASNSFSLADNKPATGVSVRGPFGSALNKTGLSTASTNGSSAAVAKDNVSAGSQSATKPVPANSSAGKSEPVNNSNKSGVSSQPGSVASKPSALAKDSASSLANKTPTSSGSKGSSVTTANKGAIGNLANRGPVTRSNSAASKFGPSIAGSTGASTTGANKPTSSLASKTASSSVNRGPGTTGSGTANKTAGAASGGASSTAASRSGPGVQRSASAATRPNVAPKPGVGAGGKTVRSFNF